MIPRLLVVHCSATRPDQHIGADDIDRWHRERGWSSIGYHYVIRRDGVLEVGRAPWKIGAHVRGHNSYTLGVCLVGGIDDFGKPEANFTTGQLRTLRTLVRRLGLPVKGHRDLLGPDDPPKDCPCFDVAHWYDTGIAE